MFQKGDSDVSRVHHSFHSLTFFCGALAYAFIPLKLCWLPVWLSYAAVTGTVATGCWVIAHECGHNAFSENRILQDFVGYTLHSLLLVPYFAWQRSHAVHHSRTNHLTEAKLTFYVKGELKGDLNLNARKIRKVYLLAFNSLHIYIWVASIFDYWCHWRQCCESQIIYLG